MDLFPVFNNGKIEHYTLRATTDKEMKILRQFAKYIKHDLINPDQLWMEGNWIDFEEVK